MVLIWRLMELERKSGKELNTERVSFMGVFLYKNCCFPIPNLTYLAEIYSKALN